jgi:hypothetical protein
VDFVALSIHCLDMNFLEEGHDLILEEDSHLLFHFRKVTITRENAAKALSLEILELVSQKDVLLIDTWSIFSLFYSFTLCLTLNLRLHLHLRPTLFLRRCLHRELDTFFLGYILSSNNFLNLIGAFMRSRINREL